MPLKIKTAQGITTIHVKNHVTKNKPLLPMPHQSYYLAVCLTVMLVACGPSARDFEHKTKIGVFGENQGMVTFEGYLYADSTFFYS